jgi:hypothetical protein
MPELRAVNFPTVIVGDASYRSAGAAIGNQTMVLGGNNNNFRRQYEKQERIFETIC